MSAETGTTIAAPTPMTDAEKDAAALTVTYTAEELRRLAAHLDDVSRTRGATKSETAQQIAEQTETPISWITGPGRCTVTCSCGMRVTGCHPQVARKIAKAEKSRNPHHWPKARDDENNSRIYG